jgi:hypothetical protein
MSRAGCCEPSIILVVDIDIATPYTMSRSDSQRRFPFPSSNDINRQNDRYPYVDEEYVPPRCMCRADSTDMLPTGI